MRKVREPTNCRRCVCSRNIQPRALFVSPPAGECKSKWTSGYYVSPIITSRRSSSSSLLVHHHPRAGTPKIFHSRSRPAPAGGLLVRLRERQCHLGLFAHEMTPPPALDVVGKWVYGTNPLNPERTHIAKLLEQEGIDPLLLEKDEVETLKKLYLTEVRFYKIDDQEDGGAKAWEIVKKKYEEKFHKLQHCFGGSFPR